MPSSPALLDFIRGFDRASLTLQVEAAKAKRAHLLSLFPASSWADMPLDRYALGTPTAKQSFSYALEYDSDEIGSIAGGSADKHPIYFSPKHSRWMFAAEFSDKESAWSAIRAGFVEALALGQAGRFREVDEIGVLKGARVVRTKFMSLYFSEAIIPVHCKPHLMLFCRELGLALSEEEGRQTVAQARRLTELLKAIPELAGWSNDELMHLLYAWKQPVLFKIAPGPAAKFWDADCLPQNMICVGWDEVGNLKDYDGFPAFRDEFAAAFLETYKGNQSTVTKKAKELWSLRDLKPGDLIAANRGQSEILAIGEVVAPGYVWDESRPEYCHTIRVDWDTSRSGMIDPVKRWATTTVERVQGRLLDELLALSDDSPAPQPPPRPTAPVLPEPELPPTPVVNRIYYGPPGTGKTFRAIPDAVRLVEPESSKLADEAAWERHGELTRARRIRLVTFHPSYSYEDFVEGIRPVLGKNGQAGFECRDGVFKQAAVDALFASLERAPGSDVSVPATYQERSRAVQDYLTSGGKSAWRLLPAGRRPAYALVVDEINRANISKVLGELITLLEPDKRHGSEHGLTITLPYSGELFAVPANLHLLGTMNTADKSIALLDVALRRRFAFQEVSPDFLCCNTLPTELRQCMTALNQRIELRKDREHRIGHAYFMDVADDDDFNEVFRSKVVPLLQEYFFHDMEGARFVLGDTQREDNKGFIRALSPPPGGEREARNRWGWFLDADDSATFQCTARLRENLLPRSV